MTAHDERDLVRQIEGHLLLAAAREEGRTAARRIGDRMSGLTGPERVELEQQLETEYLALARLSWRRTAERAEELRRSYEARYRSLRRRLLAWAVLGCAVLATAVLVAAAA
ncbi:hypothetical protein OG739_27780 [Streptomyces longwoodensis]|uniref:hypothetical protein n=1 Tax=Streptomyces longwoodensis TaxID=68231 RepID=UPI00225A1840|nr:hypothetical protein [Streptomyces longwoodensis]MCX4996499.1 hypothetical protein [Streptomyces longwoodensis]WRY91188.1 hypothetical protein OG481_22975 [Streptomyces longwoodensis]WTI44519.1 hypothetical protein OG547_08330 [Streptomyces longwoodensis]WUC57315.1 hypothetical protein OHA09_09505 [Streptomyces longwoodensis]WUC70815.1 hypothetical protein OG416_08345 [Streptomyces longwoodensis]